MKLFEATWRDDFNFFERYYDTESKTSKKEKINLQYEWFEESSFGTYSFILNNDIKLIKKEGRFKNSSEKYGFLDPMYRNIRDNYWNKDAYNLDPNIWYLDIETRVGTCSTGFPVPEKAAEPISLMQFFDTSKNIMIVLGLRDWVHEKDYKFDFEVKYFKCKNETHLLETFIELFKKLDPLIIYAWNGKGFDFPYIHNRMLNLGMDPNLLSNYGKIKY